MGTVYITCEDSILKKQDERLWVVSPERVTLLDVPLLRVEAVVVLGRATVTPGLVAVLLERGIPLSFLTGTGRYLGCLQPELGKNSPLRSAQWRLAQCPERAEAVVQAFIRGKLANYRHGLQRAQRDHGLALEAPILALAQAIEALAVTRGVDQLRGHEGNGSRVYFGHFQHLVRHPEFTFQRRVRRPPTDPVNALLSFGYALLRHDCQSAVNIVGFDPYLGFLHCERYGRPNLALDLMEEFRPLIVDSVVLATLNRGMLTLSDFSTEAVSGAVRLSDKGRKLFLKQYELRMNSTFKHPVLQKQCSYRQALEWQARLLARYALGSTDKYPPLILK
ncbi:type I-D CRISPR-associated endonuclease Cas1d [Anthocerotibacter panamensis]|uniref:type I-D CRISPR-associated endonuclease Cas1d n=1 Tax=Anthocerotibacter panamensis TaxID=2857077 RepID=UPI001C403113|nr:type I-D CRISPR-associated endonuclease Cas1d [Anthocerotibacter panamensis]